MTHYEILGVRKTATTDEIKNAYKQLVKKYHPDVYVGDKSFAEKKIKEINEAYDVLSDPEQKKEYDDLINPQTTTSYEPKDYSSYTYSAPRYDYTAPNYSYKTTSKRNAQARNSKYSYENYRKTYNSTNFGSFDFQKRYTDYHRSKTPNSNYTVNDNSKNYTEKVVDKFFCFSNSSKTFILVLIIIFFIIFFIVNTIQINSLLNGDSYAIPSPNYSNKDDSTLNSNNDEEDYSKPYYQSSYEASNPYLEQDAEEPETSSDDSVPPLEDFDINDYFTDTEIMEAYQSYGYSSYSSFEEFKEALRVAFYQAYVIHY